jgi:hypothetical protein
LLIFALLQQLSHKLGHHDLVLFDAVVIVLGSPSGCNLSLWPSGHHRDHGLYSLKQDRIVIRMSDLKTLQETLDDIKRIQSLLLLLSLLCLLDVDGEEIKDPDLEVLDLLHVIGMLLGAVLHDLIGRKCGRSDLSGGLPILLHLLVIVHEEEVVQLVARDENVSLQTLW